MSKGIDFRRLYFGKATAENEVSVDPERFLSTYYDRWELKSRIDRQDFFLVIGPKGSGKSAVGEFVRLSMIQRFGEHAVFADSKNLDEVSPGISPITAITSKLVSEHSSGLTDSAWRLYLGLQFVQLVRKDNANELNRDPQFGQLLTSLEQAGLISEDYPSVLRRVREGKLNLSFKGIGYGRSSTDTDEVPANLLGARLIDILCDMRTSNHYLLVIDGLDRIISDNDAYWQTLAGLLRVGSDFHRKFTASNTDLRLIIMCRSDVIRKIRFADADHIVGDLSLHVGWGAEQTEPEDSPLWDYAARKAGLSPELLLKQFPDVVTVGQRSHGGGRDIPAAEYLLTSTRSTPREMSLLLTSVQEAVPPGGYVTGERIRTAVDQFASRNLLTVVTAESTGLLKDEIYDNLEEIISGLPRARDVTRTDFEQRLIACSLDTSLAGPLSEFLFMAGLLGNYDPQTKYVQFYHRRDTYKFKRQGPWVLHRGLMYAFNVPY